MKNVSVRTALTTIINTCYLGAFFKKQNLAARNMVRLLLILPAVGIKSFQNLLFLTKQLNHFYRDESNFNIYEQR